MMGTLPEQKQPSLFSYRVDLERRIRLDHPLRKLKATLDLDFVLATVKTTYGLSGHVSLDPRLIVKLMLLLFYFDVSSERELLAQLGERLDWLWFLDLDLDSPIPDHSVLSKARSRWGTEVFETLFIRTVEQCVQAGLVDGRLLHIDSTTVVANVSKDSIVKTSPELVQALRSAYQAQARKLEKSEPQPPGSLRVLPQPPAPVEDAALAKAPVASQTTSPTQAIKPKVLPDPALPVLVENSSTPSTPDAPTDAKNAPEKKGPINETHLSLSDPEAQLSRLKNGLTGPSYK